MSNLFHNWCAFKDGEGAGGKGRGGEGGTLSGIQAIRVAESKPVLFSHLTERERERERGGGGGGRTYTYRFIIYSDHFSIGLAINRFQG